MDSSFGLFRPHQQGIASKQARVPKKNTRCRCRWDVAMIMFISYSIFWIFWIFKIICVLYGWNSTPKFRNLIIRKLTETSEGIRAWCNKSFTQVGLLNLPVQLNTFILKQSFCKVFYVFLSSLLSPWLLFLLCDLQRYYINSYCKSITEDHLCKVLSNFNG